LVLEGKLDAVLAGHGLERRVALDLQHVADQLEVTVVVFDDQDDAHVFAGMVRWRLSGMVNEKVEPLPGSLSSQVRPPCSSTKRLLSPSPSPVPSGLLV